MSFPNTAKTDMVRTCLKYVGSERLQANLMHCFIIGRRNQGRQPKKRKENIKHDRHEKQNLTTRWPWCMTKSN